MGTFFLMQDKKSPPYPFDPFHGQLPVYSWAGAFFVDDTGVDYVSLRAWQKSGMEAQGDGGMALMSGAAPPGFGGDGGTNGGGGGPENFSAGYEGLSASTNLWIEILPATTNFATVLLHNTASDNSYMFFSRSNVAAGFWNFEAEAISLPGNNTISVTLAVSGRTNLFVLGGVGNDTDGDGLPDVYEALVTGTDPYDGDTGDTGDTGLPDGFKDPDGDGWTNLDEFRLRQNPAVANSAPALVGLFKSASTSNQIVVEWSLPGATANSFTIERKSGSSWVTVTTVAGDVTSFTDTNLPPGTVAEYRVKANYAAGASAFVSTEATAPGTTEVSYSVPTAVARGAGGRLFYVAAPGVPEVATHYVTRTTFGSVHPKNYMFGNATHYPSTMFMPLPASLPGGIPAGALSNGPVRISTNFFPYHSWSTVKFQQVGLDGRVGAQVSPGGLADATPYLDGRLHALQNLHFVLRAGSSDAPMDLYFEDDRPPFAFSSQREYGMFSNYAVGGFHWFHHPHVTPTETFDGYRPFEDNALFRNFCYDASQFDSQGNPVTGISYYAGAITLQNWTYNFNSTTYVQAGETNIPALLLNTNDSQYIFHRTASNGEDLSAIGLTWDSGAVGWRMATDARNFYGLPFRSIRMVQINIQPGPLNVVTVQPGGILPGVGPAHFFTDTEPPVLSTSGFYVGFSYLFDNPGSVSWTPVDRTNDFLIGFGNRLYLSIWAKKSLANGDSIKFGYLEQYFDKAYKIDASGVVLTNETGILSEYGDFFPTEPGRMALVTKPDLTGGPVSTSVVHVIKLQLDVNHDGNMDERFYGPDYTTSGKPFVFWLNNDYDRTNRVDGTDFEEDDLEKSDHDLDQQMPDYAYVSLTTGQPKIPTMRDLEDYARLWTTGITNLLPGLPTNAVIELTWRTSSASNPALQFFQSVEPDGGTGYLTSETTAEAQVGHGMSPTYVGTVAPGISVSLNNRPPGAPVMSEKYIFRAAARGSGELVLRVRIGSTVLAEHSCFIQIKDVREMYERVTAGDTPTGEPLPLARPVSDLDIAAFQYPYSAARDSNTAYVLFVHGWNLEVWAKDRYAETAFKRLYWQGYQGRFGSFRWATDFNFGSKNGGVEEYWDAAWFPRHYDKSELNAWRASLTLKRLFTKLNSHYPNRLYVMAHSMGNVVVGEALRLAGTNRVVNTYVASQAAIPAHVYDGAISATNDLLTFEYNHPSSAIPFFDYGPETPNIYGDWLATTDGAASRRVNFYNANDYALAPDKWEWNQLFKPDRSPGNWLYVFSGWPHDGEQRYNPGSPDDDAPWDHFYRGTSQGVTPLPIGTNRYEIMAYAAEARSKALGAVFNVAPLPNPLNLQTIWPPDTQDTAPNQYSRHKWHSAQFRSTNMRQKGYWQALLGADGFNLH